MFVFIILFYLLGFILYWIWTHLAYSRAGVLENVTPNYSDLIVNIVPIVNLIAAIALFSLRNPVKYDPHWEYYKPRTNWISKFYLVTTKLRTFK